MGITSPFNLLQWIEDNRHLLKPPVGNKKIWEDTQFDVFIVGGPNHRKDYHIQKDEEFFYQIEGEITLKIVEDGTFKDIVLKAGDIFLLPPNIPHSPQRPAGSVGLVIEHKRPEGQLDGLRWYCDECSEMVYETSFQLVDIVKQLKGAIESFWESEDKRTCNHCNHLLEK